MNTAINFVVRIYSFLLHLYPKAFRNEFEEQMLLDFSDMALDARRRGKYALVFFFLKELLDYPLNLLWVHWREKSALQLLRSQPVRISLPVSFGFGLAGFLTAFISNVIFRQVDVPNGALMSELILYYYDLFGTANGQPIIFWISGAVSSLVAGLALGMVFAAFLSIRSGYLRFVLAVALSWYLIGVVHSVFWYSANLPFFLGSRHDMYLDVALSLLSSLFLGLIFVVVNTKSGKLFRFLGIGAVGYPLIAFIYVRLLLKFSIIETPWMFIALMTLVVVYIGSVIVIALKSAEWGRVVWILLTSVIASQLVPYLFRYIPMHWLSFVNMPYTLYFDDPAYQYHMFRMALQNGIYGIIYGIPRGLILGLVFEFLDRRKSSGVLV